MDIKRVLWVEDNEQQLNDSIRSIFVDAEKKSIDNMQGALLEIASEHLYDYDVIVLDIDFRDDNRSNFDVVIGELKRKIYLKKDQCNEGYIKENGGYLLFLYLLERGYPSDRIAFLTGNQDIIDKLQIYTLMNRNDLSREEIIELFKKLWNESGNEWEEFERRVFNLSSLEAEFYIDPKFTESKFVDQCVDALEEDDIEQLEALIKGVQIVSYDSNKDNVEKYENDMIFRFHTANLESPKYFSKRNNDIPQHNLEDARLWLNEKRSADRIFRWLVLNAGNYVEQLWQSNSTAMTNQVRSILNVHNDNNSNYDFGIRNAFRQMFFVFDGLKAIEHAGVHYQAMSAMLVPFESNVKRDYISDQDIILRRKFAFVAKNARNYCAHNYWGSAISDTSALFLLCITLTAILDKSQRSHFSYWYERVRDIITGIDSIPESVDESNIDYLVSDLWANNMVNNFGCNVPSSKPLANYDCNDYLMVLGWHKNMKTNTTIREQYYIFTLAAYIVKVLSGISDADLINLYGQEVKAIYDISKVIVSRNNDRTIFLS